MRAILLLASQATPNYFSSEGKEGGDPWVVADKFYTAEKVPESERDNVVFIITVRDPVHRFISAYNHFCIRDKGEWGGKGDTANVFCQSGLLKAARKAVNTIECNSTMYIQWQCFQDVLKKGVYWIPLEGWIERFPKSKFIVTTFDHYLEDPDSVIQAIGGAAGIAHSPVKRASHANTRKKFDPDEEEEELLRLLGAYYRRHDQRFWELLHKYRSSSIHRLTYIGPEGTY